MTALLRICLSVFLFLGGSNVFAQAWMSGYEIRRKITFVKTQIEGDFIGSNPRVELDVSDFPVLIELQDDAFKYQAATSCTGPVADINGMNIAFATAAAPTVKLSFQVERYDSVLGKYRCWVKIPILSAIKTSTPATEIYFYYGGAVLHDNYSVLGLNTWNSEYSGVWHMNGENSDLGSINVKTAISAEKLNGHGLNAADRGLGKIGQAIKLNGQGKYLHTAGNNNNAFSISVWIKWNGGTSAQMIAANDSINTGRKGWQLKVKADGKLEMTTYKDGGLSYVHASVQAAVPDQWTHIACNYTVTGMSSNVGFIINGNAVGSAGGGVRLTPAGGYISIGRNKEGGEYFNGTLDELRIFNVTKPIYWVRNEYKNQNDPASFYSVGTEEYSPSWAVFTEAANTNWSTTANWLNSVKPVSGGKVRILAGKTTKITGTDIALGQLVLEAGAVLSSAVNLQLNCNANLGAGAVLSMDTGKKLVLGGTGMELLGTGTVHTEELEISSQNATSLVSLSAEIKVSKYLQLVRGVLNANGKLTLLATSQSNAAALLKVANASETSITGKVNVQSYIGGDFPAPSSGRGWRLLSSPVAFTGSPAAYDLKVFQESIFVTGSGGAANGFDESPKNGVTIYTHDQALNGILSQKYVPVANMQVAVPLGKGVYVYSRGNRFVADAFRDQIQNQPFSNPGPYTLTYKGYLFVGDLTVPVYNKNSGDEGEGYNLLGNPYASAIKWGSLIKENVAPFIWMYDPLNGTYQVSDDPETVIPAGAGFFIKVLSGFTSGSVKFSEGAKVVRE